MTLSPFFGKQRETASYESLLQQAMSRAVAALESGLVLPFMPVHWPGRSWRRRIPGRRDRRFGESNRGVEMTNPTELRRCPRCEESLPLSEFGICRARKDGLNLYCKPCIREKITAGRQAMRDYKRALARLLRKLCPSDRVREAIRYGARTQREIALATRLPRDEVGEAIANLLLWTRT
jgi:hypothetical protein